MSEALHDLMTHLAKARLLMPNINILTKKAKPMKDPALLAIYTGQLRREFSFCAVRSQSRLLLDRLELLDGEGGSVLAKRRQVAQMLEIKSNQERQAHLTAVRQGRASIVRKGRFLTDW